MDELAPSRHDTRASVGSQQLSLIRAAAALVAVIAAFVTVEAICRSCGAGADAAVLAAIVAIGLSRRPPPANRSQLLAAPFVIAAISLLAAGVGWLFRAHFLLGALVFTAVMFFSIWLRNFGERARDVGAAIALPLIAMLVVPVRESARGGRLVDIGLVICAGIVPLGYVAAIQSLARRAGIPLVAPVPSDGMPIVAAKRELESSRSRKSDAAPLKAGISVPSRMALQMAVALAAAFAVGLRAFPGHWDWTVLTAFIVCSGARGRGDAAYKGVLRLVGAAAGTLAAAALVHVWVPAGVAEAGAIFGVLFFGLSLRDVNYAFWAGCITLILALLANSGDSERNATLLGTRLEAIFAGAACAVAAAWFVFPIRTKAVIRRRIAGALVALDELAAKADLSAEERADRLARFEHRIADLARVTPPVRWHRRIFIFADRPEHPARWVELTDALRDHARAVASQGWHGDAQRAAVRHAIATSRRALANHGKPDATPGAVPISVSLNALHDTLRKQALRGAE